MSGLFSTPQPNDPRFFEAIVTSVDGQRSVCKIKTSNGQNFDSVHWMAGDYSTPEFGDKVLVTTVLGSPLILGILPRVGDPSEFSPDINSTEVEDTGNSSSLTRGLVNDPEKPKDIIPGDKITSNPNGGLFGLLKGGTFIAKASLMAQLLISKYDDLVRIVGRNFEVFSDVFVEIAANVRGRIYRFKGYSDSLANTRGDIYKYVEMHGDTVLANNLKWNYYGLTPTSFAGLPAPDSVIRKYMIWDGSGGVLMRQDVQLDGSVYTIVQNAAGTSYTFNNHTQGTWDTKCLGGTYTQITMVPGSIVLTYNGTNTVTIDANKIKLDFGGSNIVTIDSGKIEHNFGGSNICTIDGGKLEFNYSGGTHYLRVNGSGVQMG